jgi:hypothetical protein
LRTVGFILVVSVAALAAASRAPAIIGGGLDGTAHPEVGALLAPVAFSDGTWEECSGTLISPTVFLTAEHCDEGLAHVNVTFDTSYDSSTGTTYSGTWHGDPAYGKSASDPHDLAVVVFDTPIPDTITPAGLPTLGQLSSLGHGDGITSVGYGAQGVEKAHGKGGHTFDYADVRYVATGSVNSVTPSWIRASMNPSLGDGGTCYGDSGGPNFLGAGPTETDVIAGTTITGDTPCRATNVDYRLDTPSARAFLGQFVTLP